VDPVASYQVYKEFGVAALFIVMYLGTVWFLIRQLVKGKEEAVENAKTMARALEANTQSTDASNSIMLELKKAIAESSKSTDVMIACVREWRNRP